jgi:HlyD family secretion protein
MTPTALLENHRPKLEALPAVERKPRKRWRWTAMTAALLVAGVAAGAWKLTRPAVAAGYSTAKVTRQTIVKSISATGTLQALTTVQVGTQASGTISELYADFNSHVKKDQIIARLDPSQFQAQLAQAQATWLSTQASVQSAQNNVLSAEAAIEAAQANVDRTQAALVDSQKSYDRTRQLVEAKVAAAMDLQTAQAAMDQAAAAKQQAIAQVNQAKAQAQAARSQVAQAQAQAGQAKAAVDLAQVNMDHTIIKAPIDGVVVARNVDVGQTVAASLQAPVIFLIANDLTRMQVLANIDEADVGQLAPGSDVSFTVDAYPRDQFRGKVSQVRLAPTTVQNVVTYTAVIDVPNADLKLKPGMTANVTVIAEQRENVLTVPNSALRFRPQTPRGVWKVDGEALTAVRIRPGLTDGVNTEVVSGELREGDQVATPAPSTGTAKQPAPSMLPMGGGGGRRGYGR